MPSTQELDVAAPSARLEKQRLHLIDVGPLFGSAGGEAGEAARGAVIAQIRKACRETGFFYIHNTCISDDLIGATLEQMQRFFSLDDSDPAKRCALNKLSAGGTGWGPMFEEPAYQPGTVAHLESFDMSPPMEWIGDEGVAASLGIYPNLWPGLPGFKTVAEIYYLSARELSEALFEALAEAMGLPRAYFRNKATRKAPSTMRFLNYPGSAVTSDRSNVGIAAHTDFEFFTLMYQTAPGLGLTDINGQWCDAPANVGQFTVILGDMMERLTNGEFPATGHRVGITPWQRYSIILFNALDGDCEVAPLPEFTSEERPARYAATTQSRHIEEELKRAEEFRESERIS
jgi:isopenicillin N synthase-like dioxygenase